MLGVLACGPGAPQSTDSTSGPSTDSATDPTSPTTDPTASSDPTRPTTTEPMPECQSSSDCEDTYCGYCFEGRCMESVGCCGDYAAIQVAGKWRCSPPPDDYCYSDDECPFGDICSGGNCQQDPGLIPLPECPPPDGFTSAWNLSNAPSAFLMIDLESDGDLDLIAGEPGAGLIEIARNEGAGNFILAGAFGVDLPGAGDLLLAAGDLDGDQLPDLVVAGREGDSVLRLMFNDGQSFTPGATLPVPSRPVQLFIADLNGDQANDVLTIRDDSKSLGVLLGDGTGQFAPVEFVTNDGVRARGMVADVTGDGVVDVLAPLAKEGLFAAWAGGKGLPLDPLRIFDAFGAAGMSVLTGDLDNSGLPEVLAVHPLGDTGMVRVWGAAGVGEWSGEPLGFLGSRPLTGGVLASLRPGQPPDLIASTGKPDIEVLLGDGKGGFACQLPFASEGPSAPTLLAVHDLDNDQRPEIVAGGLSSTEITVIHTLFF